MSTVPQIVSFVDLPISIKESHHLRVALSHDIMQLQNYVAHSTDVETLKYIAHLLRDTIKKINNYERENKENTSPDMENN